jgi:DNA-binding NtrC family response regulator
MNPINILIVDDQRSARRLLQNMLAGLPDVRISEADCLAAARRRLQDERPDVVLIDIRLSDDPRNNDGLELVKEVRENTRAMAIVVSASNSLTDVRTAMRLGAHDYVLKEELCEELVIPIIDGIRRRISLEQEVLHLRAQVSTGGLPVQLVGASSRMERLREAIRRAALSERPALVLGPTGSGKELVVSALHAMGANSAAPLLDLNCGALPEALVESQLFGHERGAFTGADRKQTGYLSAVGHGTLFLDEIAELPLALQAKLLRALETNRFRPVGGLEELTFKGRVVSATHADLEQRVREGRFREDLYYRIGVLPIRVPSLEERPEDIPALLANFSAKADRLLKFTPAAVTYLMEAKWPGNVRQLRNFVDRLAVFADSDEIDVPDLLALSRPAASNNADGCTLTDLARSLLKLSIPNKLAAIEDALILEAMALCEGNKSAAARLLGVHRKAVERRVGPGVGGEDGVP